MSTPAFDRTAFLQGERPGLAFGNALRHHLHGIYNVMEYGAVGDGSTNDASAIQDAIDAWEAADNGAVLYFPPTKVFKTTSSLLASFTSGTTYNKSIVGYGAVINANHSGAAFEIRRTGASVYVQRLVIEGLNFDADGSPTSQLLLAGGDDGDGAIFRVVLRDVQCDNFATGDGFRIQGSAFEIGMFNCGVAATANTAGYGIHVLDEGTGQPSSINIYDGTYDGCKHNVLIEDDVSGAGFFGGTYLRAQESAIEIEAGIHPAFYHVHVENAWQGGVASPGWATTQAGIHVVGRAYLHDVSGTANNGKMRYVARIFTGSASKSTITGGVATGDVQTYVRVEGSATGQTILHGVQNFVNGANAGHAIVTDFPVPQTKTAAYTATCADSTIYCDSSGGAFTVTLPAVATAPQGKRYTIKKYDSSANAVTVDANASETIDGATTYSVATQYEYVTIENSGAAWFVVGND